MLFGLIFFSFFPFFCHKISFALDLIIQGKHAKQFGIHFFIYLRAYTQLVKITIVLLTSTALYQCKPVQQLACQVLAFQVTLPTYAVGFCFARWKVTYSANCTTQTTIDTYSQDMISLYHFILEIHDVLLIRVQT